MGSGVLYALAGTTLAQLLTILAPGGLTAGSIPYFNGTVFAQNNANLYWNNAAASLNIHTAGDQTGTDSINFYYQADSYLPQSAVGAINTANTPGYTASSSRGTAAIPTQLGLNDYVGGFGMWGYMGSASPAYVPMAGIYARVVGGSANDKGADIYFFQKRDNNIGFYNTLQIKSGGSLFSPPGTGYYTANGIMVSTTSGDIISGPLSLTDNRWFTGDNSYNMVFNDPSTGAYGSASGVQYSYSFNNYFLTIGVGYDFFPGYGGIYHYGQSGADFYTAIDASKGAIIYRLTEDALLKCNDAYSTRLGHVFAAGKTGSGGDGTVNIYQEGSGSYWQLWLDKSDVVKGSYTDGLLDVMDADINSNKNITCLNLQASNTVIANSASIAGQCGAGNLTCTASLELLNAGTSMYVKGGTNASRGTATLVGGTVTIPNTKIQTGDLVILTAQRGTLTNLGILKETARVSGTSITIGSSNILDTSTFDYFIIKAT